MYIFTLTLSPAEGLTGSTVSGRKDTKPDACVVRPMVHIDARGDGGRSNKDRAPLGQRTLKEVLDVDEVTKEMVLDLIKDMTRSEASDFFADIGRPCSMINYASESTYDLHLLARDMVIDMSHPLLGDYKVVNFPI